MNIRERVGELYKIISDATKELEEIKSSCKHEEGYTVQMYSYRIGSYNPERLCNICNAVLPGVTKEEAMYCELKNTECSDPDMERRIKKEIVERYYK